jgi:hypothetical protein
MDDWQQQLWKQVEKTAADMEEFLVDVEKATESLVDEVSENVESFLEQFGLNIVEEVDRFVENLVDVIITTSDEIDAAIGEEWRDFADDDFTNIGFHPASAQNHPACINCANYHGQSYNGKLLVCAMHPYGWEDHSCPDWEEAP